jgi:hypothetical protein
VQRENIFQIQQNNMQREKTPFRWKNTFQIHQSNVQREKTLFRLKKNNAA